MTEDLDLTRLLIVLGYATGALSRGDRARTPDQVESDELMIAACMKLATQVVASMAIAPHGAADDDYEALGYQETDLDEGDIMIHVAGVVSFLESLHRRSWSDHPLVREVIAGVTDNKNQDSSENG